MYIFIYRPIYKRCESIIINTCTAFVNITTRTRKAKTHSQMCAKYTCHSFKQNFNATSSISQRTMQRYISSRLMTPAPEKPP